MSADLYNQLHETVDWEREITPWDVVALSIEKGCTPWYDPRFVQGYHQLLADCFYDTSCWIKGKYYAHLALESMPHGIDDDLLAIAANLATGRLPETETWNAGNPYVCPWPAPISRYVSPWNGLMLLWASQDYANKRLMWKLKAKASGYKSPRRGMYTA